MKVLNTTLALLLGGGMAMAQVAPTTPMKVADQLKPAAPPSQTVVGGDAAAAHPVMGAVLSPHRGGAVKSPFGGPAKPMAVKTTAPKPEAVVAPAPEMAKPAHDKNRRDPFVNPIVRAAVGPVQSCTSGKHCLSATEMMLRGVVKSQNGMIAVVENGQHKTYFLHENDAIFNGVVEKITGDSMILREKGWDNLGNASSHQVVKKLAPSA